MKRPGQPWLALQLWIALALVLVGGVAGAEPSTPDLPLDPVVSQVVEMLKSGVSDSLIEQWLEATDRRPADIDSRGLIALNEAGASERLTSTLLDLVVEQPPKGAVDELGSATVPTPVAPPEPSVEESSTPRPADGSVEAMVRLSAERVWVDEDEPDSPRAPRWNVFLYLDGELVAWTRPDTKGTPVETRRVMPSGRHEFRVVLQRYEELRRGWSIESLSVPTLVEIEARTGETIEVEVDMKRIWGLWRDRKDGGPMSYVIRQGSEVLAENEGTGGNPDRWQAVCEDVEANFPAAQGVPRAFRSAMNGCIRWADLWNGTGKYTSRTEILKALAEHDFEPPVR